jgi:hypothetical protein
MERSLVRSEDSRPEPNYCIFIVELALPFAFPPPRGGFLCFHPLLYLSLLLTCKHEKE